MSGLGLSTRPATPQGVVSYTSVNAIGSVIAIPNWQVASVAGLGLFRFDATSTATVDDTTVLATASGEGRWLVLDVYGSGEVGPLTVTVLTANKVNTDDLNVSGSFTMDGMNIFAWMQSAVTAGASASFTPYQNANEVFNTAVAINQ